MGWKNPKVPVLFDLPKKFVFYKTTIIITIKNYEWILDAYICNQRYLLIFRWCFIIPLLDCYRI